ncbi:hypothetical protein FGG15_08135 [Flagellimonas algicola]|uniref:Methane monooxygenase PmoA-like n=2 Tax=Flagellimonas algicola TaxID=2583815 RepID=A0ABY2WSR9_9FLAO|nr:hypothetical protein FGG15_08135 [Allomuricauda algicola]
MLSSCITKDVNSFEVKVDGSLQQELPISVNLDQFNLDLTGSKQEMVLLKESEGDISQVPFQWNQMEDGKLWFVHNSKEASKYRIEFQNELSNAVTSVGYQKKQGNLQLLLGENPVVSYQFKTKYPPTGVDSIYGKSGYVHPLVTPKGDTLTRIQPPDHYHHYGVWGPWTRTRIGDRSVDFWNLGEGQGTVRFKGFGPKVAGDVFASLVAHQEHVDFGAEAENSIALNEKLELRLWGLEPENRYVLDYTSTFSSPLESGLLFEAYRYGGGIGMRFTERWHKDNCKVLTSEGNDRLTADGSNARWCIVSGESADGSGTSGILFLSHPENRMHPEPMRVWPIDGNGGRGDMFFEFCPIRHEPWQIESKKEYQLKYRMIVFDGELGPEEAESYWQLFANQPWTIIVND